MHSLLCSVLLLVPLLIQGPPPLPDRFTVSVEPPSVGQEVEISFDNPGLANKTVTIEITDGGTGHDSITIDLDGDGKGSTTWEVPAWHGFTLSHSTSLDHSSSITP
ncbi:MAG: hypothetical protein ACE5F1_13815 [Planctomycetota bacterium]